MTRRCSEHRTPSGATQPLWEPARRRAAQPAQALQCKQGCFLAAWQNTFSTREHDFVTYHLLSFLDLLLNAELMRVQRCFAIRYPCKWQPRLPPSAVRKPPRRSRGSGMRFGAVATFECNGISF